MPEESHLEEMRDAIRGDFERLAERRGEQELMRVSEPDAPNARSEEEAPTESRRRSWLVRLVSP